MLKDMLLTKAFMGSSGGGGGSDGGLYVRIDLIEDETFTWVEEIYKLTEQTTAQVNSILGSDKLPVFVYVENNEMVILYVNFIKKGNVSGWMMSCGSYKDFVHSYDYNNDDA